MNKPYKYSFVTGILLMAIVLVSAQANNSNQNGPYNKMHYELVIAAKKYNEYSNNKLKSTSARDNFKNELQVLSKSIVLDAKSYEPTIDVLIETLKSAIIPPQLLIKHKVIEMSTYNYYLATIKIHNLQNISNISDVLYIEPSFVTEPLLTNSTRDIKASDVWKGGNNIPNCITGKDVFIGIIDSKINKDHITFKDKKGNSRFIEVVPFDNYDYNTWPDPDHGTHVAGIAAGSGNSDGKYKGVAYDSKLLWYPSGGTNNLIDAVESMVSIAKGKPLVINHSYGFFSGPRNGSLKVEMLLSELIDSSNIHFVNSAGNQSIRNKNTILDWGRDRYYSMHIKGEVSNDRDNFASIILKIRRYVELNNNEFSLKMEIWHENDIDVEIDYNGEMLGKRVGPGDSSQCYIPNTQSTEQIIVFNSKNDNWYFGEETINASKVVGIIVHSQNRNFAPGLFEAGEFTIRVYPHSEDDAGRFDAYICENGPAKGGFINGDNYQTVVSPGLIPNVICVASHNKFIDGGDITDLSSLGPLRSDRSSNVSKPDITAPGAKIKSSVIEENSYFDVMSGTSMAAPHVTGAIALLLQCFPRLTAYQVKDILQKSAGSIPSGTLDSEDRKYWGAGKLDIMEAFTTMAGFSYERPYAYDEEKYKNAFAKNPYAGLPFAPVIYNWGKINYSYQKFTNGAIFCDNTRTEAHWLGEGIWKKWIELDSTNSQFGLPVTSEFVDKNNDNCPTVLFENGKIFWRNHQAFAVYLGQIHFKADITHGKAPINIAFSIVNIENDNIVSCMWDFGDGNTSNSKNPVHTYEKTGKYDVQLIIDSPFGVDTITESDYISLYESIPISSIEYFFDTDPGYGKGINIPFSPNVDPTISFNVNYNELIEGYHKLCVRAKDAFSNWGTVTSKHFYALHANKIPFFTHLEYYFDTDPGFGKGKSIPIRKSPSENIENFILDFDGLDEGYHTLYIRGKDNSGQWGHFSKNPFYRYFATNSERITEIEYYIDHDPGNGNGIKETVTPTYDLDHSIFIDKKLLTQGTHTIGVRVKNGYLKWSETKTTAYTVNLPPIANAGPDQTVNEGVLVTLDGSGSSDPDNDALTYQWTASVGITLNDATAQKPTFTAPEVTTDTHYIFTLVVNDGKASSVADHVIVTIKNVNKPPVANAGFDQTVNEGVLVTLDGSSSLDPDVDALTYQWTAPADITLNDATSQKPTFTATEVTTDTDYTFTLVVNDGKASSVADHVIVTIKNVNKPPVANAGSDQTVNEGVLVTLDGSGSSDSDSDALTYQWTAPVEITLNDATAQKPTFTAPEVTTDTDYIFTLVVNDGKASSVADHVIVTIKNVNKPPVANAGSDQTVNEGALVTLNGGGSFDPDGDALTYHWTSHADITLSDVAAQKPTFSIPVVSENTQYSFSLIVNDGFLNSEVSVVNVAVQKIVGIYNSSLSDGSSDILIYPNPANIELYVHSKHNDIGKCHIRLVDVTGRVVGEWLDKDIDTPVKLSIPNTQRGLYSLVIIHRKGLSVQKVIIE
jgi:subtilisin family serine protease/PKD repeat protein